MANRRSFLQQSSILAAGSLVVPAFNSKAFAAFQKRVAASDQLNIGAIGINGMGWSNVKGALSVPGVNIVALCDVDKNVLDKRFDELKTLQNNIASVKLYADYRKLLEQKDIDAVIIGTPDHWHAMIMIAACQAGKDIYV